ncbi:MAG: hypothetical protein HQ518_24220 [Rhodopirellula sp.]|nr:hypothetical protein [Rhodopirellula sp.]
MTRYFTLLAAAYGLLAIETTLPTGTGLVTPYGSFVWMLLPWLATLPSPSASIVAAAAYGLMIDAFSNLHPGLLIAGTIASTGVLQRIISPKSLETPLKIFVVSVACGILMAMLVATCSMATRPAPVAPSFLASSILTSTLIATLLTTLTVVTLRSCGRVLMPNQNAAL